ncbi:MAG: PIN domain-containing protein [Pseudonocardiaceae bacterium]|nr:PIN domain-containing protein [Pseudonocardiaceae bacterium]
MAFPAFLDTCVLFPAYLTDTALRLAAARTYRPLWSAGVFEELRRNLIEVGIEVAAVDRRIGRMREAFPDAEVSGYEALVPAMTNDPKDRHVLAAAVRARAEVIVTFNLKDFATSALEPFDLVAVHPDDFLLDQLDLYPKLTLQCLEDQAASYKHEPTTVADLMARLARSGVPRFAGEVLRH